MNESGEINADLAAAIEEAISNTEQIEKTFRDGFQNAFAAAMGVNIDQIGSTFDSVASKYAQAAFSWEELLNIEREAHEARLEQFSDLGLSADTTIQQFRVMFEAAQGVVDGETLGRWWAAADVMSDLSATLDQISDLNPAETVEQHYPEVDELSDHLSAVYDYVNDQMKAVEQTYQDQIRLLEEQQRMAADLRNYVKDLRLSELSPDGPAEKLAAAQENLAALMVRAESGDLDAVGQLQSAADAYLGQADSYYGRSDAYTEIFNEVTGSLDQLGIDLLASSDDDAIENLNRQMLNEQEQLRQYAQQELSWAITQSETLTGISGLLSEWPDKFDSIMTSAIASIPQPAPVRPALNIPAFASGGDHTGGLRLVGEYGPELEVTGASRIFNAADTQKILSGNSSHTRQPDPVLIRLIESLIVSNQQMTEELRELRSERSKADETANNQRDRLIKETKKSSRKTPEII